MIGANGVMGPNQRARLIVGRQLSPRGLSPSRSFCDSEHIGVLTDLGAGRIIDGCVTSLWYDYQHRLNEGCAPSPFTEKLAIASLHEPAVADDQ